MIGMMEYSTQLLRKIPEFLMSDPIVYIVGTMLVMAIVAVIIKVVKT